MTRTSERRVVEESTFARQKRINSKTRPILENGQATQLRFMTWNVLAQSRTADSFPLAPLESLAAPSRGKRLLLEILRHEPDVLCLQEVDASGSLSTSYFEDWLGRSGYVLAASAVKRRGSDGCCIFIRRHLKDSMRSSNSACLADTKQVGVVLHLQDSNGLDIVVGTTHLKAKPGFEAVRERQARHLRELMVQSAPQSAALVLCGDFNAERKEPAMVQMELDGWKSAYEECCNTEPYSTWKIRKTGEVKRCIDYVWLMSVDQKRVWVDSCLLPPSEDQVQSERFPSWQFPSDHINLVVDLTFYCL
eukprot:CAMPEP_0184753946 /NCGR_PEP_ID=MMETSP0315-20130426/44368_1 /TAXON_ID=101924 /ORGANISM="Rhodosorus marinus, Strain UTEX LB 2760" /LENGTH=305 /DNA_ID=CAMNT_0027233345 /DNA_START=280 /DNA_END=1197 /DNA_ORIENTATION=+